VARTVSTLNDLLHSRADRNYGYLFCDTPEREVTFSFCDLDRAARAIATLLAAEGLTGERALLLHPPGPGYLSAFFGCLYAGVVPVPVFPPDPGRPGPSLGRLAAVAADAQPRAALTTAPLADAVQAIAGSWHVSHPPMVVATDSVPHGAEEGWRPPRIGTDSIALIQYTSGSTSSPKGVALSHGNLLSNSELIRQTFGNTRETRALSWLPPYHDMGLIGGVIQPLYGDFSIVLMPPMGFLANPLSWLRAITRHGISTSGGPNFAYDLCVRRATSGDCAGLDLGTWQVAFNGAEPVRAETLDRFAETFGPFGFRRSAFLPCYGLAEATLMVTGKPAAEGYRSRRCSKAGMERGVAREPAAAEPATTLIGSGRLPAPADGEVHIADPATGAAQPDGVVGEIRVAGPSVASGYWNSPEASAATFGRDDGKHWLRTGDLGFTERGELFVTGRAKDLITVRGRNIYPQDIEHAAASASSLLRPGSAAAFDLGQAPEPHLVLVQELAADATGVDVAAVAGQIRSAVAACLDVHVHTVALVAARVIPKTSSGKVQRARCRAAWLDGSLPIMGTSRADAEPDPAPAGLGALLALPPDGRRSRIESYLCERIGAVTGTGPFSIDAGQPFDSLGLDSMDRVELLHRIEQDLRVEMPLGEFLREPSLTALAGRLADKLGGPGRVPPPGAPGPGLPSGQQPRHDSVGMSYGQRALWFLQQFEPANPCYNLARAFTIAAGLDSEALDRALSALVAHHLTLRTTYPSSGGTPSARLQPAPAHVLHTVRLGGGDDIGQLLQAEFEKPFDLERDLPVRARLFVRPGTGPVLSFVVHHIAADLWSLEILVTELSALYPAVWAGQTPDLAPLPTQYADFVDWQERVLRDEGSQLRAYWLAKLHGEPPICELPDDLPRPPRQTSRGAAHAASLGARLSQDVRSVAVRSGVTVPTVLLSALQAVIHRWTGLDDILIGMPASGRQHASFATVVGYFLNTLVLRADLSGNPSFTALLRDNAVTVKDALVHQDFPFPLLAEDLQPVRDPAHAPLVQVMFVVEQARGGSDLSAVSMEKQDTQLDVGGLKLVPYPIDLRVTPFDLTVRVAEIDGDLVMSWQYNTDVLRPQTVARMSGHFATFLASVAAAPDLRIGEAPLLAPAERRAVLRERNQTDAPVPAGTLMHDLIIESARRDPAAVAVRTTTRELRYGALVSQAATLAARLQQLGVTPEARVGICLGRSPELIVAILAVLMAGGAYVPIDPAAPASRIGYILADAGARVLIAERAFMSSLPGRRPAHTIFADEIRDSPAGPPHEISSGTRPENLAYVIYTSGSTGHPKGVMVTHANLVHSTHARRLYFPHRVDSFLLISSPAFDSSVAGLFWTLYDGGTLVLPDAGREQDPAHHKDLLERYGVSHFESVPSLYRLMLDMLEPGTLPGLRSVVVAGEACGNDIYDLHRAILGDVAFTNEYGPTEASVWCTAYTANGSSDRPRIPIGGPIANTRIYIRDRHGYPVPDGVDGELYVGGLGIARGYLNRPNITAEMFVPDPFGEAPGGRLYRTGDLVRRLHSGELEFLGRSDGQLNIRGFRVEPGEVEGVLQQHPSVHTAAVTARADRQGELALVAYVVPPANASVTTAALREHLARHLPAYMIPAIFAVLDGLPLTTNGKVDYGALPLLEPPARAPGRIVPARDHIESLLCGTWAGLIGLDELGIYDNVFECGAHSLHVTQVAARIRSALGVDIPLRSLFEAPTVAELAKEVRQRHRGNGSKAPAITPGPDGPAPLSFSQQRLWFLDQLVPDNPAYNIPVAIRLRGRLDHGALAAALRAVVHRHSTLRTVIDMVDGQPVARTTEPGEMPVPVIDIDGEAALTEAVGAEAARPFDIRRGPLIRATLYRVTPADHVLLVVMHHIVSDGWSLGILASEVSDFYRCFLSGGIPAVPVPPIQYADYAHWQRGVQTPEALRSDLAYWAQHLADAPPLWLATDRPRRPVQTFAGRTLPWSLDPVTASRLHEICRETDSTLFMVLLAAFSLLMSNHCYTTDVVVGTPVSGRGHSELDNVVGFFANTVVLRTDTSGDPAFTELVRRVRGVCLDAYARQHVPFELVIEAIQPTRDLSSNPMFQVVFALQNAPVSAPRFDGLTIEILDVTTMTAKFDLNVSLWEADGRLQGFLEYNTDLFDHETIAGLAGRFTGLLRAAAADAQSRAAELAPPAPEPAPPAAGPREVPHTAVVPMADPYELFQAQVAQSLMAPAFAGDAGPLSYQPLQQLADQRAGAFARDGAGPAAFGHADGPVTPEGLIGLLAALKFAARAGVAADEATTLARAAAAGLAHRLRSWFELGRGDRIVLLGGAGAGTGLAVGLWPLTCGATVVAAEPAAGSLGELIREHQITVVYAPPEPLDGLADDLRRHGRGSLRQVISGPAPLAAGLRKDLCGLGVLVSAVFGPPDVPCVLSWTCPPDGGPWRPLAGAAADGYAAVVLDRFLRPAETGAVGRLGLTGPAFGPAGGGPLLTGELARPRADGAIERLGPLAARENTSGQPTVKPEFVAPRTPVEEVVGAIWSDVLDSGGRIGIHDSFFDLGGQSLLATLIIMRMRSVFQLDVPVTELFEQPTIAGVASAITRLERAPGEAETIARIWQRMSQAAEGTVPGP
jgi:amino acid adenylation domain-containing protein